jgi:hypothetical protein
MAGSDRTLFIPATRDVEQRGGRWARALDKSALRIHSEKAFAARRA